MENVGQVSSNVGALEAARDTAARWGKVVDISCQCQHVSNGPHWHAWQARWVNGWGPFERSAGGRTDASNVATLLGGW